jgi:subtilisin family serine protease
MIDISPAPASANSYEHKDFYTIFLKSTSYNQDFTEYLSTKNIRIVYQVEQIGLYQVETTLETVEGLANEINWIESYNLSLSMSSNKVKGNKTVNIVNAGPEQPIAPFWDLQWDMKKTTNNGLSFNITEGSKDTVVGIIDSGVYGEHPDLKGSLLSSRNFVPKGGFRGEEPNENGDIHLDTDYMGHGTFVAGQITANGLMKGIAPEIGIRSYRVFGSKSAESIWVIDAIIQAALDDVDVINLSLGTFLVKGVKKDTEGLPEADKLAEIKAYKKAVDFARRKGSIVVAAVGNEGLDLSNMGDLKEYWKDNLNNMGTTYNGKLQMIPAQLQNVVTVSSVGPNGEVSIFSNYGKNIVDISAFGGDLRLLNEVGEMRYYTEGIFLQESILSTSPDGTYTFTSGTSIAAPKVSGALALIIENYDLQEKPNKAINHLFTYGTEKGIKEHVGNGILNIYKALSIE